ncbi:hypothetical protein P3X46_035202, partial [Hevea brasiliensis]
MKNWCSRQKGRIATKFGTAKEATVAGRIAETNIMEWDNAICTLHPLFPSSAFAHTSA